MSKQKKYTFFNKGKRGSGLDVASLAASIQRNYENKYYNL